MRECVSPLCIHSAPKRASARSSRLPPPTSCVQAAFCGFRDFTSTVFGVWLLRGSRGELLFRPSFLCDRLLMHLRLSALYEQGRARASAFSFGEVLFSFVRGSWRWACCSFRGFLRLNDARHGDILVSGVYRSRRPRLEAAACRTHRAVGGNDDAA